MLKPTFSILAGVVGAILLVTGSAQPAPSAPAPTALPVAPTKAVKPTKAPAIATKATADLTRAAAVQPTSSPAKKADYPSKGTTITLIVPWPPGGSVDTQGRVLATAMEKELGVPISVVNKPGAGTQIGLTELARSKPDGYTIGIITLPTALPTYLDPDRKPTYARKNFQSVAGYLAEANTLAVKVDSPFKTLKDLVDAAKATPGKVKVADAGLLTVTHLGLLLFQKAANVEFASVHFDGGAPALTALLGGHVDAQTGVVSQFLPSVKNGKVRVLGVMDRGESKFLPGVKTMEAQGYRAYMLSSSAMVGPSGLPGEVVATLDRAVRKAMDSDGVKKRMDEMGLPLGYTDAARYTTFWTDMEAELRPVMELAKQK